MAEITALSYYFLPSPFGEVLMAGNGNRLHFLLLGTDRDNLLEDLITRYPPAGTGTSGEADKEEKTLWKTTLDAWLAGQPLPETLRLDPQGSEFQRLVWSKLLGIPRGETRTYRQLAMACNTPVAVRAVGTACGSNPISLLVPCHRVLRSDGTLGGYYWGLDIKQKLLDWESGRQSTTGTA
jgi:AraC family transcriptional regulator of adaptative response/methylated-DNA-[protein]-cysteine methyltransferase